MVSFLHTVFGCWLGFVTEKLCFTTCIGIYANAKLALLELYFELGDRKQMLRTITLLKKMKVCLAVCFK